ncbi:MAG: hypothetical protein KatS3mg105_0079 [Gemmatales bacterium]|nr:MAG: hypothetical protein KatS3mg105_0079 [Gemmatales bacterium]
MPGASRSRPALALDRGDYFRAVILAYEALIILGCQQQGNKFDPLTYENRQIAEDVLQSRLQGEDRDTFRTLKNVRNACAHGSRPQEFSAQQCLQSVDAFCDLIKKALGLFERFDN